MFAKMEELLSRIHVEKKEQTAGQTLVEIIVALSIATILSSAITLLSLYALNNAQADKNENLAQEYALEGVEAVKTLRDQGTLGTYGSYTGIYYCMGSNLSLSAKGGSTCPINVGNIFSREVDIGKPSNSPSDTLCGASLIDHVTVTVSWTDSKCTSGILCHSSQLQTCLEENPFLLPTP